MHRAAESLRANTDGALAIRATPVMHHINGAQTHSRHTACDMQSGDACALQGKRRSTSDSSSPRTASKKDAISRMLSGSCGTTRVMRDIHGAWATLGAFKLPKDRTITNGPEHIFREAHLGELRSRGNGAAPVPGRGPAGAPPGYTVDPTHKGLPADR